MIEEAVGTEEVVAVAVKEEVVVVAEEVVAQVGEEEIKSIEYSVLSIKTKRHWSVI
jgi:hypothetical protein